MGEQLPSVPMLRLLNGMVYCPMNSLSEVESWSSMTKRTTASSGTYTSNWKFSFHDGLKPFDQDKYTKIKQKMASVVS